MPRAETPSLFADVAPVQPARDEMNFAEFPTAVLTSRAPKDCFELVFSDVVQHKGKAVTRRLTVTATPKYGLPTPKDEEVLLALVTLSKRQNDFSDSTVTFTRHELIRLLGLHNEGHYYKRVEESLHRWASVYLHYENAWYDNDAKELVSVGFHVIDGWQLGTKTGRVTVRWSEPVLKSFRSDYVKRLDLTFYQSLDSVLSKRLYRYLDKHLYHPPHRREIDLDDLAYAHLGLSRNYALWKVKQLIESATYELEERGYLEPLPTSERFKKLGRGKWQVQFARKGEKPVKALEAKREPEAVPLVGELVARGLHEPSARKLVAEKPAEVIAARIEAFDWLMTRRKKPESPSGYLFTLIDKELPLPDGFTPSTVKKVRAEVQARKRADEQQKLADERKQREAERAKEAARVAAVEVFLGSLSEAERADFERKAVDQGPPDLAEKYRSTKAKGVLGERLAHAYRYQLLALAMEAHRSAA